MSKFTDFAQEAVSITAVPLYHWRGAQPCLFDLPGCHQGWLTCLHLIREGESKLMPIAWEHFDATGDDDRTTAHRSPLTSTMQEPWQTNSSPQEFPYPVSSIQTQALHSEAVTITLNKMEQDGWQINGRFDIYFTGIDTDPNFQHNIHKILWHSPAPNSQIKNRKS